MESSSNENSQKPDGAGTASAGVKNPLTGFWSLFVTQFQGAFSDNVLKNLVVFMIIGLDVSLARKHSIGEAVGALFALPFILFSMAGGFLADRYSKRSVTIAVKVFEIAVMIVVFVGLANQQMKILLTTVFLMGTHSAFFGPSKYGLLPELLPEKKLSWGNGILELGTFVAIILGTVAAAWMATHFRDHPAYSGVILISLAGVGLLTSLGISRVPPAARLKPFRFNVFAQLWEQFQSVRHDRPLSLALMGNAYFLFVGALVQLNLFFYGADVLHLNEIQIGYLNVSLALGIGLGSVAAGYLSGGKIEYGLVPLGAVGLAGACISLAIPDLTPMEVRTRLALLGFAGGFFIVPVSALLQHRPAPDKKGEVLASANLLAFVGAFLASGMHYVLAQALAFTPGQIFLVAGLLTITGAVYAVVLLPDALLRFVLWVLTRTLYRIRVAGRDNIPAQGGALFVCNHVSFVDALLLLASTDRRVRFMLFKGTYDLPYVKPFARILRAIPISSEQRPRDMIKSLQTASEAIKQGHVVCIFAEGQITRIGQLLPFRRGMERIMKDVDAPIIPVALDGVWGSIFSFEQHKFVWKWPRRIPYPVTVSYGKPMPANSSVVAVRQEVQTLLALAWHHRREHIALLHRGWLRNARRHPRRFAMADAQGKRVSFGGSLIRTIILARRLRRTWQGQHMVGILLPPSVPGALVNFAALLMGKVPVNLNYTVSATTLESCVHQCEIKTCLTSKVFLEKAKLAVTGQMVFLEDLATPPSAGEKLTAFLMAFLLPASMLERALGREKPGDLDDLATVIFSSGSTGEPKGVMLSHYNIGSNIEQMEQVLGLGGRDCVLGILPFFHSFGFTGTLCLPAVLGIGVAYHANPLDAKTIGPLVREHKVTFLLSTPTFLQIYMRGCGPEDFGSLRVVITGAEKLPDRLAAAFEERFGVRPIEGYGCTECAPAVALNTHDFRAAGFRQVGAKRGKIGHPLPGVSVKIVNPEDFSPVALGDPGMLLVRGPNVMQGYLGRPDKTAEVIRDGWYVTGDVAAMDEDGFLQITDRLSRFSKIGGEMVPHIKVEEKLHEAMEALEQTFVVTGVPDEKKGERLVVLHRLPEEKLQTCLDKLNQSDLPNLWKPRLDQFFRVEAFPYLGTGKLDLRKVKEVALSYGPPPGIPEQH